MLYLAHHGIKGQKWGVRRYQNPDGTLTPEGVSRYSKKALSSDAKSSKYEAKGSRYEARAEKYRAKETRHTYKRDKIKSRRFQTDVSIARANRHDTLRARSSVKASRYEFLSKTSYANAKKYASDSKSAQSKITKSAVDDMIKVMDGSMSQSEFNKKYYGTGFRIA